MRLPLPRATALVAIITALVAASGFTPARTGPAGRDRDRVLRVTRAGPQRLESPDGPIHSHEETDAVYVPAGDVIGISGHADVSAEPDRETCSPVADLTPVPQPHPVFLTLTAIESDRLVFAPGDLELHAPDRAPPTAS
jgi:hypothetical protein